MVYQYYVYIDGRSPQGECGLKFSHQIIKIAERRSLPARGVWIEIFRSMTPHWISPSRSPQGECGLKLLRSASVGVAGGVAPRKGSVD